MKTLLVVAVLLWAGSTSAADEKPTPVQSACYSTGYYAYEISYWLDLIKKERSNAGGVVDMDLLHCWGIQVQANEDKLKEDISSYKPFARASKAAIAAVCEQPSNVTWLDRGVEMAEGLTPPMVACE